MRKLVLTIHSQAGAPEKKKAHAELLALWSRLGSSGLTAEAKEQLPLLAENARFVVSLAQQFHNEGVSQEVLITAAHVTLVSLLNQYAGRPKELDKVMALALRSSMAVTIKMQAG